MKNVNVLIGRFQPFHNGHLQVCRDARKENGFPTVVMYIHNEKFDQKKPFSDGLLEKEFEILKQTEDCFEDAIWLRRPWPTLICRILQEHGYNPILWLAGEDRIDGYRKLMDEQKIRDELNMEPPAFYITQRYGSATDVRNALKSGNKDFYMEHMPVGTEVLFEEFTEQLKSIING